MDKVDSHINTAENYSDSFLIRQAQESDLEAILQIYNYHVINSVATFDLEVQSLEQRHNWFIEHKQNNLSILVLEINQKVRGWASLSFYHSRCAYKQTLEPSMYIDPEYQNRGYGKHLMKSLLASAQNSNFHAILALVCKENAASIALAEKFGFEKVGILKEVGFKFNRYLDVIILERIFQRELY